jgi:hypothetical protein
LGTAATPRFDGVQTGSRVIDVASGVMITKTPVGSNFDDHHYVDGAMLSDVSNWATTGAGVLGVYHISPNGMNVFENKTLRWVLQVGASRWLSGNGDFLAPILPNPNSDRVFWAFRWKDDDPGTGIAYGLFSNRGTRQVIGNYDANALVLPSPPVSVQPYFDWGSGDKMTLLKIVNPMDASMIQFSVLAEQAVTGGYTDGFQNAFYGDATRFTYESGVNSLNQNHRQSESLTFTIVDP